MPHPAETLALGRSLARRVELLQAVASGQGHRPDAVDDDLGEARSALADWLRETGEDVRTDRWHHLLIDGQLAAMRVYDQLMVEFRLSC